MQIVVMIDRDPYDPFMGAMQQLKAAMLSFYAKERQLECEMFYHEHFTWYVVETDEAKGTDLVNHLALRGCVDIHVHTEDEVSADVIDFSHGNLFRVCRNRFVK